MSRFYNADVVSLAAAESAYYMRWLVAPLVGPDLFLLDMPVPLLDDYYVLFTTDVGRLTADCFELTLSA